MAFGNHTPEQEVLSEINMIPLIDVMLVLLIVFIITVPVMNHAVAIDLPRAASHPQIDKPDTVNVTVDAEGTFFWNEQPVEDKDLMSRLVAASAQTVPPELRIRGDKNVRYERIAQVMADAQRAGIQKIGFVTTPAN